MGRLVLDLGVELVGFDLGVEPADAPPKSRFWKWVRAVSAEANRGRHVMSGTAIGPPWRWPGPSEEQRAATRLRLWATQRRGDCSIGCDGHMVYNGEEVFVLEHTAYRLPTPIQRVDYFIGDICGHVIAQMCYGEPEVDVPAIDMLHPNGCVANAMRHMQRHFVVRRYNRALQAVHLLLPIHIIVTLPEITHAIAQYLSRM